MEYTKTHVTSPVLANSSQPKPDLFGCDDNSSVSDTSSLSDTSSASDTDSSIKTGADIALGIAIGIALVYSARQ